jgi:hypothetical protein
MLSRVLAVYTFTWAAIYAPGETFYTLNVAGPRGLIHPAYVMNVIGMAMMCWGATAMWRLRPHAPGLLAAAWSWTAATMWRATADRFWYVSLGRELPGGTVELWLGPLVTLLALLPMAGALVLVFRQAHSEWPTSGGAG